jgi:F-type H+-transporting ATPase subunit delta
VSTEAVARRYAQALFELALQAAELERIRKDLGAFVTVQAESADFRAAASNPLCSDEARDRIVVEIGQRLGAAELCVNLVRLLGRRRRLGVLAELGRQFGELCDEHQGVLRATVRSATPLSPSYLDRLRAEMEQSTGKKVVIRCEHDPSLIAGIVTQIGDRVVDGSIRGKLDQLRQSLRQT